MHRAIRTSFVSVCDEGCVVVPGPGRPPPGSSARHFACAAWNAGDERFSPAPTEEPPRRAAGSGKLGTPLARMHFENASSPDPYVRGDAEREFVVLPPVTLLGAAVLTPSAVAVAVAGYGELPPQPASRTPIARVIASNRARAEPHRRCGEILAGIWSSCCWCRSRCRCTRSQVQNGFARSGRVMWRPRPEESDGRVPAPLSIRVRPSRQQLSLRQLPASRSAGSELTHWRQPSGCCPTRCTGRLRRSCWLTPGAMVGLAGDGWGAPVGSGLLGFVPAG